MTQCVPHFTVSGRIRECKHWHAQVGVCAALQVWCCLWNFSPASTLWPLSRESSCLSQSSCLLWLCQPKGMLTSDCSLSHVVWWHTRRIWMIVCWFLLLSLNWDAHQSSITLAVENHLNHKNKNTFCCKCYDLILFYFLEKGLEL